MLSGVTFREMAGGCGEQLPLTIGLLMNIYNKALQLRESGGNGRRTGLRIQPARAVRGSTPLSRTRIVFFTGIRKII